MIFTARFVHPKILKSLEDIFYNCVCLTKTFVNHMNCITPEMDLFVFSCFNCQINT